MRYHVVLRGPSSSEPGAARALAEAIASRYGVPVDAITERLSVGGFRVKSDVDLDTAMSYAVDLTKLGGATMVVDAATGKPVEPATQKDPVGLAAASSQVSMGLGALDSGDIVVATLDGQVEGAPPAPASVSERGDLVLAHRDEDEALALDSSPYQPTELAAPSRSEADFAPPTSDVADEELILAEDPRQRNIEAAPAAGVAAAGPTEQPAPATGPSAPSFSERAATLGADARKSLAGRGRFHFAAGALLAVLLGFVAAHVIGVIQESSAYAPVRKELREAYAEATDPESHAVLPQIREGMQELLDSRQRRIAVTSGLVWIAAGAGFGFLWFRKIRWERLA